MTEITFINHTPYSPHFADIYFSAIDGFAESQYVFLQGNQLPQRWASIKSSFYIGEIGFGTGLNFFTTWLAWETYLSHYPLPYQQKLYFISIEKYPLTIKDIEKSLSPWPTLTPYLDKFKAYYKLSNHFSVIYMHLPHLEFSLLLGDANKTINDFPKTINAWYLDGFAPAKNPELWQESLFNNIAQHTISGGSFATFTAAGKVKRGLAKVGFEVIKIPGFAHKKEMLIGKNFQN